ncbi:MAG: terpene cyclase/mutase family protein [Planctomycetes bacterium]|nr:terpene cyclase/mutase family protein [Planctomycetota bacterium]
MCNRLLLIISLCLILCSYLHSENKEPKKADPVNAAIDNGVAYLLGKNISASSRELELVALTLLHCDVKPTDPKLKALLEKVVAKPLIQTYHVGLKAMVLESCDRIKYQPEIADCAQALVNWQSVDGRWSYVAQYRKDKDVKPLKIKGTPRMIEVVTDKFQADANTPAAPAGGDRQMENGYEVKRNNPKRPSGGDNSNTQFALLGLRAAARAGVTIPKETWQDAQQWLLDTQSDNGGWSYQGGSASYGSMTCAGVCGLAITKCYLGEDFQNDPDIIKGLDWLANNLEFSFNPSYGATWHYYWIYGVERVGAVLGLDNIGGIDWYKGGADYLLTAQNPKDGQPAGSPVYPVGALMRSSWNDPLDTAGGGVVVNTCFALLFLKKATPKIVITNPQAPAAPAKNNK